MKLAIFGATGKTGLTLVKQALERGHEVTAFVRDQSKLEIENENLSFVVGDIFDISNVNECLKGQEVVICSLGAGSDLKKTSIRTTGTKNIISEMEKIGVRRLIAVSAMGTGESWDAMGIFNKLIYATLLKNTREDHEAQEFAIKKSGLEWTIVRPSGLNDKPKTGIYVVGPNIKGRTSQISRADVAHFILDEIKMDKFIRQAVSISN